MAVNVGDLQVTLSIVTQNVGQAISGVETVRRAHQALSAEVESSSAAYRELKLNVSNAVGAFEEAATKAALAQKITSELTFDEIADSIARADEELEVLNRHMETYISLSQAGGRGVGQVAYDQVADQIGYTKDELHELIQAKEMEIAQLEATAEVYDNASQYYEEVIRTEADLEQQTNKLIKANRELGESTQGISEGVEQTAGSLRSGATRMNYYIQALANGNITQTLVGQSAALAGQGVQKLQAAMAGATTIGEKLSAAGSSIAASIKSMITPTTAAIAAVGIAIAIWMKWRKEQEAFEKATYDVARALENETRAIEETTYSLVKARVETKRLADEFRGAGVGVGEFTIALTDDTAFDILLANLEEASNGLEDYQALSSLVAGGSLVASGVGAVLDKVNVGDAGDAKAVKDELVRLKRELEVGRVIAELFAEAQKEVHAEMRKTADYATLMAAGIIKPVAATEALTQRMGDLEAMMSLIAYNDVDMAATFANLPSTVDTIQEFVEELKRLTDQYPQLNEVIPILEENLRNEADAMREAADAAREKIDADNAAIDGAWSLVDAAKGVAEAMAAYEEEASAANSVEVAKAWQQMAKAAAAAGPQGIELLVADLQAMFDAGLISAQMYHMLLSIIAATTGVAAAAAGNIGSVAGAASNLGDQAAGATGDVNAFIGSMFGAAAGIGSLSASIAALNRQKPTFSVDLRMAMAGIDMGIGRTVSTIPALEDLNAAIAAVGGAWGGIGGGGGGGGGAGGAAADIDEVATAAERAAAALGILQGALSGVSGIISASLGVDKAKQDLADLREELENMPQEGIEAEIALAEATEEVAKAQEKLNAAWAEGEMITAASQAAIDQLEDKLWLAQKAYEAGIITIAEYNAVKDELQAAKDNAETNVSVAQDELNEAIEREEAARKRVEEIQERSKTIMREIELAELAVLDAILGQLEAQGKLEESMGRLKDLTQEEIDLIYAMAEAAGVAREKIDAIRNTVDPQAAAGQSEEGSPAGQVYTVKAGDSPWSIAKALYGDGRKYKDLISKNIDLLSGRQGYPDSPMLFVGDLLKYHAGGIVPYRAGVPEVPALLKPGERVIPKGSGSTSGGVTIQNLTISASWPITDAESRKLAQRIREALRRVDSEGM